MLLLLKCSVALIFTLLICSPLTSCTATATNKKEATNSQATYQKKLFTHFDQDKNGTLTKKEFSQVIISGLFDDFDADKNNQVSRKEFFSYAHDQKSAQQEYPIMDTEGKGYITRNDAYRNKALLQHISEEFKKLDPQNKGHITFKDLPQTPQLQKKK